MVELVVQGDDVELVFEGPSGLELAVITVGNVTVGGVAAVTGAAPQFTVTAFETISALRVVTQTANGAELFDPATDAGVFGVSTTAATAGNDVTVQTTGLIASPGAGLTPGEWYYAGPSGTLVTPAPLSGPVIPIGYAADADSLIVRVGDLIELV